jgi:toxin ParE1/3/4
MCASEMRNYFLDPEAEENLDQIWLFIAEDNPAAATRVVDAAYESFETILSHPHIGKEFGSQHPRLRSLRVWPVESFPQFLIIYRATPDHLQIVRILRDSRDIEAALL